MLVRANNKKYSAVHKCKQAETMNNKISVAKLLGQPIILYCKNFVYSYGKNFSFAFNL